MSSSQRYETIIIGAGVAGLACAQKLKSVGKDFIIITENVGGKIQTTRDNQVNLGACLVMGNYKNVLPLINKTKQIHLIEFSLHSQSLQRYGVFKIFQYPLQLARLIPMLLKFRSAYERFKREAEINGQKIAFEKNPYLLSLYQTLAADFAKSKHIYELTEKILGQPLYACTGLPLSDNSAFDLLRLSLGLITPMYEFSFHREKITSKLSDHIIYDTVTKITRGNPYTIDTKSGRQYQAANVVVATPPQISQQLLSIPTIKKPNNIFSFYIEGELKDQWRTGEYQTFDPSSEMVILDNISTNTCVLYSKKEKPNLSLLFENQRVLEQKNWCPAFHLIGSILLDCRLANGLYLIGDHNIAGLEDSYITGLYAANQIINPR